MGAWICIIYAFNHAALATLGVCAFNQAKVQGTENK
jgi:hypothetical protein